MAARDDRADDYQPQAADLGSAVQLDSSDTLDGPAGDIDGLDAGYVPPDRPYVAEDDSVSARGQRDGDTLDERLAREEPDEQRGSDPDRAGRLTMEGEGAALETGDALAGVDVGIDGGAASAEEAAVHENERGGVVESEGWVAGSPALADPEADAEVDRAERDAAARIDAEQEARGAAAPASGRVDAGPGTGL